MDPKTLATLRAELLQAMKSDDVITALDAAPNSINTKQHLLEVAAASNVLPERFLNSYLGALYTKQDRVKLFFACGNDALGHPTLRKYWGKATRIRDCDPNIPLSDLIEEYRATDPGSLTRLRWISLIFDKCYQERNWEFVLCWTQGATDRELISISKPYMYGVLTGLLNCGLIDNARKILSRMEPLLDELGSLYFSVPRWRLRGEYLEVPTAGDLVRKLHSATPDRGPEWDWFCETYLRKLSLAYRNFMNIRVDVAEADELRGIILQALENRQPFSFQRIGDGEAYQLPLPEIAKHHISDFIQDDLRRERAWWGKEIESEQRIRYSRLVLDSIRDADILGFISPYRLIRDASHQPLPSSQTGRAFLALVEAMETRFPLSNKIVTEDRAHTVIYTKDFLEKLVKQADSVVVVGGIDPRKMGIKCSKYIPLIPEQNKGLSASNEAQSIVEDFEAIRLTLMESCKPGTLVLVSGGYVGKILVHCAKSAGAVALDIGSLADLLAGYHTRSPADAI